MGKTPGGKSSFGSNISKTGSFGSTISKTSSSTSKSGFTKPSFIPSASSIPPSTSRKTNETFAFSPKSEKSSTSMGIIWIPTKKRNKKKELVYSSMNYDKKNERAPSMYNNFMSGDSSDFHKKKDEEANLLIPERLKGPIATVASAGPVATIAEETQTDNTAAADGKPPKRDNEESKEAAGDANDKEDKDYLENNELIENKTIDGKPKPNKSFDKVDSAFPSSTGPIKPPPPRSADTTHEDEDCCIKCLYYTLQCCDCVLM